MVEVVGVKFKISGKVYYFTPKNQKYKLGETVIVETARGLEHADVVVESYMHKKDGLIEKVKPIVRHATEEDMRRIADNDAKRADAIVICKEKIENHGLEMKVVDAEYTLDGKKVLFYFTADGRVDFRELVKDLASVFRVRIELRQIGVRDEAKMIGGIGICGRDLCCTSFLSDFHPVTIRMAKEQGLSLNPTKISGVCGRLMCCLKYEQDIYEELIALTPSVGSSVLIEKERGTVIASNILTGMLTVSLEKMQDAAPVKIHRREAKLLKKQQTKCCENKKGRTNDNN